MEVYHCKAQHEVLLNFIRHNFHFWGPWDQLPLSCWIDHSANRVNHPPRMKLTPELKLVLTRPKVLSEECCRHLHPPIAALRFADRSQAFADILKDIQWYLSVVFHGRICRNVKTSSTLALKEFPWDAKIGPQEQVWLKEAEEEDWQDLMLKLEDWDRDHEGSAEQCGNVHDRRDHCLGAQFIRKWSGQGSSSDDSNHPSLLWSFDDEAVYHGQLLGTGSFAVVRESTWLGNKYAQKKFVSGGLSTLRSEEETLAKLNHPHIVKVHACSENSLLLDLMSTNLRNLIEDRMLMLGGVRDHPFSLPAATDLMLQIADAVSYLHSQGMVHQDLKLSNILLNTVTTPIVDLEDGIVFAPEDEYVFAKVANFGLAKIKHEVLSYLEPTCDWGSRRYMASEIFKANNDDKHLEHAYSMKVDVYNFRLICFEILTGEEPYSNVVPWDSLYSKLLSPTPLRPQLPSSCPTTLVSLIKLCWDADPQKRPTFRDI